MLGEGVLTMRKARLAAVAALLPLLARTLFVAYRRIRRARYSGDGYALLTYH